MTPTPLPTLYGITPTDQFLAGHGDPWPLLLLFGLGLLFLWLDRRPGR
jgi:hypothetical protein